MALFGFGKKKEEEKKAPACCCGSGEKGEESTLCCCSPTGPAREEGSGGVGSVKVLGAGCKSCHALYESATAAVRALGLNVEVEYITDMQKIMEYGAMSMPALVVNEQVVSMGRVLKAADVEKLLTRLGGGHA